MFNTLLLVFNVIGKGGKASRLVVLPFSKSLIGGAAFVSIDQLFDNFPKNHAESSMAVRNFSGTRSTGAWRAPGLPSWPQAAI